MAKIDYGNFNSAAGTTSSPATTQAAQTGVVNRIRGVVPRPSLTQVARHLGIGRIRRMLSPLQVTDGDLSPISDRSEEEYISDLSKMLVALDDGRTKGDQDVQILKLILKENIRRMMVVQTARVASAGGPLR